MCGISGIWNRSGETVERQTLLRMTRCLAHRGPDHEGFLCKKHIGFGVRRLRIIDFSEQSNQPMQSIDNRLWLACNGEIHNYQELRLELKQLGYCFLTNSDTEVVLQAYAAWGTECFNRFNGMWALAIWDEQKRELLLSRDRFGMKPLYYSLAGPRIAFASEAKAIIAGFPEENRANLKQIYAFLCGSAPDAGRDSFFENIHSLTPGCYARITSREIKEHRYWQFSPNEENNSPDAHEEFHWLLQDSVRLRLRADTAIGALVSGGLDSSGIIRLAAPQTEQQTIHCFSLRYPGASFDESGYAKTALRNLPNIISHWVEPSEQGVLETLSRIVWHHDAPTPLRGRYAKWFLMRQASEKVRVLLTGQGADELLAGYHRFAVPYLLDRLRRPIPHSSNSSMFKELCLLRGVNPGKAALIRDFLGPLIHRKSKSGLWPLSNVLDRSFAGAFRDDTVIHAPHLWRNISSKNGVQSLLNRALWEEFRCSGLPELLHLEDALSMAFSIETRNPFLDHRLVEFCFSLPYWKKIAEGSTKHLLRKALHHELPEEIRMRRGKQGLPSPVMSLLHEKAAYEQVKELLLFGNACKHGMLDARRLERGLAQPQGSLRAIRPEQLWRLITLELWLKQFIDRTMSTVSGPLLSGAWQQNSQADPLGSMPLAGSSHLDKALH